MVRRALIAGIVFVFVLAGIARSVDSPREETPLPAEPEFVVPAELEARLAALESENARLNEEIRMLNEGMIAGSELTGPLLERFPVPESVTLCGERLPLERPDVYQRFEEEWTRFLVNQHWVIKWIRRSRDIFPYVEAQLAVAGVPDDLKYVLIVESGLESRAYSSAGAAGWWQFIKSTGNRYGLKRDSVVDERRDLGLATAAAIDYFTELYEMFGSWPLALSAYNAGDKRVRDSMEQQGESDFYALSLPRETEAYWFKAATVKLLLEDPERYGIKLTEDPWVAAVCDTLQLKVSKSRLHLRDVAAGAGISYREFRELNPAFRRSWVPSGTHRFVLPHESVEGLLDSLDGVKVAARQEAPDSIKTAESSGEDGAPDGAVARPGLSPDD
jgi:hypothetical protein